MLALVASTLHWIQHLDSPYLPEPPPIPTPSSGRNPGLEASDGACIGEAIPIPSQRW